jgi:hypothetical protein
VFEKYAVKVGGGSNHRSGPEHTADGSTEQMEFVDSCAIEEDHFDLLVRRLGLQAPNATGAYRNADPVSRWRVRRTKNEGGDIPVRRRFARLLAGCATVFHPGGPASSSFRSALFRASGLAGRFFAGLLKTKRP